MAVRWFLAVAVIFLAGCSTQRTLRIETDPPGADVWVNNEKQEGTTPVDVPFIYYQTFEVRLEKRGYLPFAGSVPVSGGIDGYPIVDLPSELTVRHRGFTRRFELQPLPTRPGDAGVASILDDAATLREEARRAAQDGSAASPPAAGGRPPSGSSTPTPTQPPSTSPSVPPPPPPPPLFPEESGR